MRCQCVQKLYTWPTEKLKQYQVKTNEKCKYHYCTCIPDVSKIAFYLPLREHFDKCIHQTTSSTVLTISNEFVLHSATLYATQSTVAPFFLWLLAVFQKCLKRENSLLLQGKQLLVSFIKQLFEEKKRERAMQTFNLFIQSYNWGSQGLSFVKFLWKNQGAWTHYIYRYSIFIFQLQSKLANMPSLCIFSSEPCLPTIISTDILCANAVIDTFITSKGIQFSFQSSTGMNSATSSAANNEGPLPRAKGWLRLLYAFKGKVCQTVCQRLFQANGDSFQTGQYPILLSDKCHFCLGPR